MNNAERRAAIESRLSLLASLQEQIKAAGASGQMTTYSVLQNQVARVRNELQCNYGFNQF